MARLKDNVQENWLKIRWTMERSSVGEYRARIQSHTDTINMVLNTLLLCECPHNLHSITTTIDQNVSGPQPSVLKRTAKSTPRSCWRYTSLPRRFVPYMSPYHRRLHRIPHRIAASLQWQHLFFQAPRLVPQRYSMCP
jgi:hypothetical protein